MIVQADSVKFIVGKQGKTIKSIRRSSGAVCYVDQNRDKTQLQSKQKDNIIIRGNAEAIKCAKSQIEEVMKRRRKQQRQRLDWLHVPEPVEKPGSESLAPISLMALSIDEKGLHEELIKVKQRQKILNEASGKLGQKIYTLRKELKSARKKYKLETKKVKALTAENKHLRLLKGIKPRN